MFFRDKSDVLVREIFEHDDVDSLPRITTGIPNAGLSGIGVRI